MRRILRGCGREGRRASTTEGFHGTIGLVDVPGGPGDDSRGE